MKPRNLLLHMEKRLLKKWLARPGNTHISPQNPWYLASERPRDEVSVYDLNGTPLTVLNTCHDDMQETYIIKPDIFPNIGEAIHYLGIPPEQIGFYFSTRNNIPAAFRKRPAFTYTEIVQHTGEFDPTLDGPDYSHLRQNFARAKRQRLQFEPRMTYRAAEISDLVVAWVANKHYSKRELEQQAQALKMNGRIANVALNPFGTLYGVRGLDGTLHAAAAVLKMGDYASIECLLSTRKENRAQEFLEINLWRELIKQEVQTIGRGYDKVQSPALLAHKTQFAPLHRIEWFCAAPIYSRSKE